MIDHLDAPVARAVVRERFAPELAAPYVHVGASMLVMEGPRVVAAAVLHDVYPRDPRGEESPG